MANILTKDRDGANLDIAAKDIGGIQHPRNIITDPAGNDITPATELTLDAILDALNARLPELSGGRVPVEIPAVGGGLTDSELRAEPLAVTNEEVADLLRRVLALLTSPRGYDRAQSRQRVTAAIESGTVTTVGTVSNISQIAGRDASMLINAASRTSWALNHRSRIS